MYSTAVLLISRFSTYGRFSSQRGIPSYPPLLTISRNTASILRGSPFLRNHHMTQICISVARHHLSCLLSGDQDANLQMGDVYQGCLAYDSANISYGWGLPSKRIAGQRRSLVLHGHDVPSITYQQCCTATVTCPRYRSFAPKRLRRRPRRSQRGAPNVGPRVNVSPVRE